MVIFIQKDIAELEIYMKNMSQVQLLQPLQNLYADTIHFLNRQRACMEITSISSNSDRQCNT